MKVNLCDKALAVIRLDGSYHFCDIIWQCGQHQTGNRSILKRKTDFFYDAKTYVPAYVDLFGVNNKQEIYPRKINICRNVCFGIIE